MGYTSVAVLHNDMTGDVASNGGEIGRLMAHAMRCWSPADRESGYFRVGNVVSRDHSSAHQVVVIYGNTGCHVTEAKDVSYLALGMMADCLQRHGWSAKPPEKSRRRRHRSAA